jgi:hypothetical protein
MAKLIVVTRAELKAAQLKLEKLLAKDPRWQELKRERERSIAEEKARRDAEWAEKQAGTGSPKGGK